MNKLTKILIFAVVFFIPAYLLRFGVFGIPTNVLEILIYSTFISWALEKQKVSWKELYENYQIYIFSVVLIFLGLILSTLVNQNYREGFGIIKGWFFDPLLFAFILIQKIEGRKDIENIFKTLYFSAFIVSLIAFEYFFYGHLTYDGRLQAFFGSPNYLAMFLAPSVFIGFFLKKISGRQDGIKKYVLPATLFLISLVIFLTYSYSAWISIIFSLLAVRFIAKTLDKKFLLISALVLILLFLAQINNPKLRDIFSERSSLSSRMMIWKSSALMIKNNLVFGIGPGNFQNKYLEYQKYFPFYLEWAVPEPHSLYLAFWLQSGIFGLSGLILLILYWSKETIKKIRSDQKNSTILAVSLGIILYVLIHGLFDTTYWKNDLSLIIWIIIALSQNKFNLQKNKLF